MNKINVSNQPHDLRRVAMPLVHVLRQASLSWKDREYIADALLVTYHQWHSMMREHEMMMADRCAGQQRAPVTEREPQ